MIRFASGVCVGIAMVALGLAAWLHSIDRLVAADRRAGRS